MFRKGTTATHATSAGGFLEVDVQGVDDSTVLDLKTRVETLESGSSDSAQVTTNKNNITELERNPYWLCGKGNTERAPLQEGGKTSGSHDLTTAEIDSLLSRDLQDAWQAPSVATSGSPVIVEWNAGDSLTGVNYEVTDYHWWPGYAPAVDDLAVAGAGGAESFTIYATSEHGSGSGGLYAKEHLHDNLVYDPVEEKGPGWTSGHGWNPAEVSYEFTNAQTVKRYRIWPRYEAGGMTQNPRTWELRAAADKATYDAADSSTYPVLDTQALSGSDNLAGARDAWPGWNGFDSSNTVASSTKNLANTYNITNTTAYKYYVLRLADNFGASNYVGMNEWALYVDRPLALYNYPTEWTMTAGYGAGASDTNTIDTITSANSPSITGTTSLRDPHISKAHGSNTARASAADAWVPTNKVTYGIGNHQNGYLYRFRLAVTAQSSNAGASEPFRLGHFAIRGFENSSGTNN